MSRVPAFLAHWFDVFWHDPKAPVDTGKRALLAVGAFGGAFLAAYPEVVSPPAHLIEPIRWLAMTISGLSGWGNAKSKPTPPAE